MVNAKSKDNLFQKFDKQVNFGISSQNGFFNTRDAATNTNQFSLTAFNFEVEYLTNVGIWWDFNASIAQTYTQPKSGYPLGDYPYLQTMNAKLGYNFPVMTNFAVVPYITFGKNTNLTNYTSLAGQSEKINVTNNFFYTLGGGLRLELPINKYVQLYADQLIAGNFDQTNYVFNVATLPQVSPVSTSNIQSTTTLGVKVNPWDKLQLGANVFYNSYTGYNQLTEQFLSNLQTSLPVSSVGYQLSVGFTFN
jgi:hypothetical protein